MELGTSSAENGTNLRSPWRDLPQRALPAAVQTAAGRSLLLVKFRTGPKAGRNGSCWDRFPCLCWWRSSGTAVGRGGQSCCLPRPATAGEDTQFRHWEVRPVPLCAEDVVGAGSTSRFKKGLSRILRHGKGSRQGSWRSSRQWQGKVARLTCSPQAVLPPESSEHGVTQTPFLPRMAFLTFVFSHLRCQSEMLQSRKKILSEPHKD